MSWVKVENIKGGQLVACYLCGRRICRATFMAVNTNYAEAFRLATAYAWEHEHSEIHKAALEAFHEDEPPPISDTALVMNAAWGTPLPDEKARRRARAKDVANRLMWEQKRAAQRARQLAQNAEKEES